MSHRIHGLVVVCALVVVAGGLARRHRLLLRELTAERAGTRLVDQVVQADHEALQQGLEQRLSDLAAAVGISAPSTSSRNHTIDPKEGGQ
ncbi:hypothetical protein ACFW9D_05730 [Streptomyces sp. NPDC059524]|uniref:hypothetical protein n=1 Tax=Streptomyces sp. NPDC059524 TaxID=3346856 RepID=UPI0036CE3ACC